MKHRFYACIQLFVIGLSLNLSAQNCQLHPPSQLYVSDITSCGATLNWTSTIPGDKFVVSYKASTSSQWSPTISAGTNTFYHFNNLQPSTHYLFSVKSKCTDGSFSPKVKKSAVTLKCSLPDDFSAQAISSSSVKITVSSACSYDSVHISYSAQSGPAVIVSYPFANSYIINGLTNDSIYTFQVSTCPLSLNNWTLPDTVHLQQQPNIVFILIDDSRYDYFSTYGAPSFFHTPNIDRIGNEGVKFDRAFVVTSLCAPSRASIATGLFTLKTGVTQNNIPLDTTFTTLPKVFKENGYYTALVGKNHDTFLQGNVPEFNYYLEEVGYEKWDGKKWNYNGTIKDIGTEYPRTITDTTIALIKRVDQPFLLWVAPKIPHFPLRPLPSFDGLYDGYPIPWKADTAKYQVNYPSYLYSRNIDYLHGYTLDTTYRTVLEVIAGLDSCIGEIIKALEITGKLDNTLLIFTDDNGFMLGNHWLNEKTMAYEPSMRVPLLIRYPKWFQPATTIKDQFALNLDIAPTMYEAAGITYNEPLDGVSLKKIYDGSFSRKEFYYIMLHNPIGEAPTKRCIRDEKFKYIKYSCSSDTVEELFDMVNDSLELVNLVNNHQYNSVLHHYQHKLDSIKHAWKDTVTAALKDCFIENPSVLKQLFEEAESTPLQPVVYPTLTSGKVEIYIPWPSATGRLFNQMGELVEEWKIADPYSVYSLDDLRAGMYYMNFSFGNISVTRKIMLQPQ